MPAGYAEPYRTVVLELSHEDYEDFGSLYQNPLTLLIRLDTLFASFNTVPDDLVVLRFAESLQGWERVPATMDFPWLRIHTKANSLGMFVISETVDEATSVDRGVAKASVEGATVEPKATVVQAQIGLRIDNVTLESPHPLGVHPSVTPAVVPTQVPLAQLHTDTGCHCLHLCLRHRRPLRLRQTPRSRSRPRPPLIRPRPMTFQMTGHLTLFQASRRRLHWLLRYLRPYQLAQQPKHLRRVTACLSTGRQVLPGDVDFHVPLGVLRIDPLPGPDGAYAIQRLCEVRSPSQL